MSECTDRPPNLPDLPNTLLLALCQLLIEQRGGSPRDVVSLALASRCLHQAVAAADELWVAQCQRLGWSLDWLLCCRPLRSPWAYFSARMRCRWVLRTQLRQLLKFLDPLSRACLAPRASVVSLQHSEAALQLRLPWELFELYSFADGQEARAGVQFAQGARLLSLAEVVAQVRAEHSPTALGNAFQKGLEVSQACGAGASTLVLPPAAKAAGGCSPGPPGGGAQPAALEAEAFSPPAPSTPLLPFTDSLRGGRDFAVDFAGRVWLRTGWGPVHQADSLADFLRAVVLR